MAESSGARIHWEAEGSGTPVLGGGRAMIR